MSIQNCIGIIEIVTKCVLITKLTTICALGKAFNRQIRHKGRAFKRRHRLESSNALRWYRCLLAQYFNVLFRATFKKGNLVTLSNALKKKTFFFCNRMHGSRKGILSRQEQISKKINIVYCRRLSPIDCFIVHIEVIWCGKRINSGCVLELLC